MDKKLSERTKQQLWFHNMCVEGRKKVKEKKRIGIKRRKIEEQEKAEAQETTGKKTIVIPKIDYGSNNLKKRSGVYFIGSIACTPNTNETIYWVKIGLSTDIDNRLKTYHTHNPCFYVISVAELKYNAPKVAETIYQGLLREKALCKNPNSAEWWSVSEEVFASMCEKGFGFFKEVDLKIFDR